MLMLQLAADGQLKDYLDKDTLRALLFRVFEWGPGFLILVALYSIVRQFLAGFIESQKQIALAMNEVAQSLKNLTERDLQEREEIRLALGLLTTKIERHVRHGE